MGARAARMLRNFNLENRVHREISKEKPRVAPRHRVTAASSTGTPGGECPLTALCSGSQRRAPPSASEIRKVPLKVLSFLLTSLLLVPAADVVSEKNESLLNLLQSVYVESSDPAAVQVRLVLYSTHSPATFFMLVPELFVTLSPYCSCPCRQEWRPVLTSAAVAPLLQDLCVVQSSTETTGHLSYCCPIELLLIRDLLSPRTFSLNNRDVGS